MSAVDYKLLTDGGTKLTKVNGRGKRRYVAYVDQHALDTRTVDVKLYSVFDVRWITIRQAPKDLQAAIRSLL